MLHGCWYFGPQSTNRHKALFFQGAVQSNGPDLKKKWKLQLLLCAFHHQHGEVHHHLSSIIISLHAASITRRLHHEKLRFGLESTRRFEHVENSRHDFSEQWTQSASKVQHSAALTYNATINKTVVMFQKSIDGTIMRLFELLGQGTFGWLIIVCNYLLVSTQKI